MKIVVLDGYCLNPGDLSWSGMEAQGALTVYDRTPLDGEDEIVRRIGDSEIVLTNKTPISRRTLERCPGVKYIGILATGYNVVDTEAARERSIPVCNVPGYGTRSVAQAAIALLLEICHHVGHHDRAVHQGAWSRCADYCFWDYPLIEHRPGGGGDCRRSGHGGRRPQPPQLAGRERRRPVCSPGGAAGPQRRGQPPLPPVPGDPGHHQP